MTAPKRKQTRLNVNINMRTEAALAIYAETHDISITEAVRRLVGMGSFIANALEDGKTVQLKKGRDIDVVTFFA